jgi:hypothetical protein
MGQSRVHFSSSAAVAIAMALASACGGAGHTRGDGGTGGISIDGGVVFNEEPFVCPAIAGLTINPASVPLADDVHLRVDTVGPPPSVLVWSATPPSGGAFSDAGATEPTFHCAATGVVGVTVHVGIADPSFGDVCSGVANTDATGRIRCGN